MRNRLLEDYSEQEVLNAAKKFILEKLGWSEDPIKVYIDPDSILLIYENDGEDYVDGFVKDGGVDLVFVRGKRKKYRWIEFEHYDGLRSYLPIRLSK